MANLTRYELPSDRANNQALSRILRETRAGRLNVISEITLANGATSTVIKDSAIGRPQCRSWFRPARRKRL